MQNIVDNLQMSLLGLLSYGEDSSLAVSEKEHAIPATPMQKCQSVAKCDPSPTSISSEQVLIGEFLTCSLCDDSVESAISIQCGHTLCVDCTTGCVKKGGSSKRLTFNHLYCPFRCGCFIGDSPRLHDVLPDLAAELSDQKLLIEKVEILGLERLKEDGLASEDESNKDLIEKAMRIYAFYHCNACKDVFFGGAVECEVAAAVVAAAEGNVEAEAEKEIICVKCSCVGKPTCEIHGDKDIEWKCMFCCKRRPATYLCGGVDNYCDECHKNPGKCTPCDPTDCIFDGDHPPSAGVSGVKAPRFSLGCVLCNGEKSVLVQNPVADVKWLLKLLTVADDGGILRSILLLGDVMNKPDKRNIVLSQGSVQILMNLLESMSSERKASFVIPTLQTLRCLATSQPPLSKMDDFDASISLLCSLLSDETLDIDSAIDSFNLLISIAANRVDQLESELIKAGFGVSLLSFVSRLVDHHAKPLKENNDCEISAEADALKQKILGIFDSSLAATITPAIVDSFASNETALNLLEGVLTAAKSLPQFALFNTIAALVKQISFISRDRFMKLWYLFEEKIVADMMLIEDDSRSSCSFSDANVTFSPANTEQYIFSDHNRTITTKPISSNMYCPLTCSLDSGIWSWTLEYVEDKKGDEGSTIGLCKREVKDPSYSNSKDLWMLRCYNGEVYCNGVKAKKNGPKVHPADTVRLELDVSLGTLSIKVNGVDHGVIMSDLPPGLSPAIAFYSSTCKDKSWRLLNVSSPFFNLGNSFLLPLTEGLLHHSQSAETTDELAKSMIHNICRLFSFPYQNASTCQQLAAVMCTLMKTKVNMDSLQFKDILMGEIWRILTENGPGSDKDNRYTRAACVALSMTALDADILSLQQEILDICLSVLVAALDDHDVQPSSFALISTALQLCVRRGSYNTLEMLVSTGLLASMLKHPSFQMTSKASLVYEILRSVYSKDESIIESESSGESWACGACTFLNALDADACEVCETKRGKSLPNSEHIDFSESKILAEDKPRDFDISTYEYVNTGTIASINNEGCMDQLIMLWRELLLQADTKCFELLHLVSDILCKLVDLNPSMWCSKLLTSQEMFDAITSVTTQAIYANEVRLVKAVTCLFASCFINTFDISQESSVFIIPVFCRIWTSNTAADEYLREMIAVLFKQIDSSINSSFSTQAKSCLLSNLANLIVGDDSIPNSFERLTTITRRFSTYSDNFSATKWSVFELCLSQLKSFVFKNRLDVDCVVEGKPEVFKINKLIDDYTLLLEPLLIELSQFNLERLLSNGDIQELAVTRPPSSIGERENTFLFLREFMRSHNHCKQESSESSIFDKLPCNADAPNSLLNELALVGADGCYTPEVKVGDKVEVRVGDKWRLGKLTGTTADGYMHTVRYADRSSDGRHYTKDIRLSSRAHIGDKVKVYNAVKRDDPPRIGNVIGKSKSGKLKILYESSTSQHPITAHNNDVLVIESIRKEYWRVIYNDGANVRLDDDLNSPIQFVLNKDQIFESRELKYTRFGSVDILRVKLSDGTGWTSVYASEGTPVLQRLSRKNQYLIGDQVTMHSVGKVTGEHSYFTGIVLQPSLTSKEASASKDTKYDLFSVSDGKLVPNVTSSKLQLIGGLRTLSYRVIAPDVFVDNTLQPTEMGNTREALPVNTVFRSVEQRLVNFIPGMESEGTVLLRLESSTAGVEKWITLKDANDIKKLELIKDAQQLCDGDRVLVKWDQLPETFPGSIIKCRPNGTYDVQYDNGQIGRCVSRNQVRQVILMNNSTVSQDVASISSQLSTADKLKEFILRQPFKRIDSKLGFAAFQMLNQRHLQLANMNIKKFIRRNSEMFRWEEDASAPGKSWISLVGDDANSAMYKSVTSADDRAERKVCVASTSSQKKTEKKGKEHKIVHKVDQQVREIKKYDKLSTGAKSKRKSS